MQGEEPEGGIATVIAQQVTGRGVREMLDGQLMLADAARRDLGIEHQIMADAIKDRAACQGWAPAPARVGCPRTAQIAFLYIHTSQRKNEFSIVRFLTRKTERRSKD